MLRQKHGIREGSRLASMLIYLATGLCCIVTVYPMYYVLILSLIHISLTSKILSVVKYILTSVRKGSRNGRSKMDRHPK